MRSLVPLTAFVFCSFNVLSQQPVKVYLDKYQLPVGDQGEATSYRIVSPGDFPGSFQVKEYYMNDTLKQSGAFSDADLFTQQGEFISYYRNGQKKSYEYFTNDKPVGTFRQWYENGQLKETRFYKDDNVKIDSYYDSLGKAMVENGEGSYRVEMWDEYAKYRITFKGPVKNGKKNGEFTGYLPDSTILFREEYTDNMLIKGVSYINGKEFRYETLEDRNFLDRYIKHVSKNLRYPSKARRLGNEGTVYVWLIINPDYTVKKAMIAKSVSPELDAEALRVFRDTGFKFGPMMQRGIARDPEKFCAPLKFKLAN